jgi:hypothetical protein
MGNLSTEDIICKANKVAIVAKRTRIGATVLMFTFVIFVLILAYLVINEEMNNDQASFLAIIALIISLFLAFFVHRIPFSVRIRKAKLDYNIKELLSDEQENLTDAVTIAEETLSDLGDEINEAKAELEKAKANLEEFATIKQQAEMYMRKQ